MGRGQALLHLFRRAVEVSGRLAVTSDQGFHARNLRGTQRLAEEGGGGVAEGGGGVAQ